MALAVDQFMRLSARERRLPFGDDERPPYKQRYHGASTGREHEYREALNQILRDVSPDGE